ncbi:MAG TPA: PKD domain-containing protein, partial [Bacteroidales bacterium]|nr:PKD domain-containing protein [Bacteroidales bacterium]
MKHFYTYKTNNLFCRRIRSCIFYAIILLSVLILSTHNTATAQQCTGLAWANWQCLGTNDTAHGTINISGHPIGVTMTANYNFSWASYMWLGNFFDSYTYHPYYDSVLSTTFLGPGGVTQVCFSEPVTNPVLIMSSLGNSVIWSPLSFSESYVVLYTYPSYGNITYINDTSLTASEGYCILMFPGTFSCITVLSNVYENATHLSWGVELPFEVDFGYTQVCPGIFNFYDSTNFSDNPQSVQSWKWYFGDGDSSTLKNPTHLYSAPGNYQVQLIVTFLDNCKDTATQTINVLPNPSITNITDTICTGNSFNIIPIDGTNGTILPGTLYSWPAPSVAGISGTSAGNNESVISGTLTNSTS